MATLRPSRMKGPTHTRLALDVLVGGVSGPCQPIGCQCAGMRTVVWTGVGLGKKMGATSVGVEGTEGRCCFLLV